MTKKKDMCITQKLRELNGKGITSDKILNKLIKYIKIIRKWWVVLKIQVVSFTLQRAEGIYLN